MKKFLISTFTAGFFFSTLLLSQVSPKEKGLQAITADAIKGQLEFLSSDWMEGRATGEKGSYLAADYIASMFKVFGAAPAGDAGSFGGRMLRMTPSSGQRVTPQKSYFQNFTLVEVQPSAGSVLSIKKGTQEYTFDEGVDFSVSRATMDIKFEAPLVFVGYGLVDKANGIDDFAGVDVKGKIIVRLAGFPGYNDNTSPMYKKLIGDNIRAQFEMTRKKSESVNKLGVLGSGVKPKRSILFCAWTGEEKGLYGSEYFTMYPSLGKISDYKFYMNFDMIARDAANDTARNMAGITYTKAYPRLEEITKSNADQYKLNLKLNIRSAEAPTGGSDYTAFTENKIPVIAWMAAMHPDYHQPSDEVSLVNWNKMLDIIKLGYLQLWEAANGEIQ